MFRHCCKLVKTITLFRESSGKSLRSISRNNIISPRVCNTWIQHYSSFSTEPASGYVDVNGVSLHYMKVGHGDHPILLMPGALGSATTDFGPQLNGGFDPDTYTVIGWDPRGYGKSRPPDRTFPLEFFQRDADDAKGLMQALGYDTFTALGWSDGGITALRLASQHPENMRKLVVWGANAFVAQEDLDMYENTKNINDWSEKMRQPMIDMYGEDYFSQTWHGWVEGITNIYVENKGDLCSKELHKIRCPTLILHGEKDPMVPKIHPGFLQQKIMGSRLINFLDGKHNIHLRYAEEFNRHVDIFLRK